jgi:DHA2 family multidrug resistance protein
MNKWIIAIIASLAAGMEIMDASIVNIAMPHMQGSLSAGVDEIAWVLTAYLVANAIMIPMTGWLATFFGRKRFFIFSTILFGTCSALAGMAPTLLIMVIIRVFQGVGGGALTATGQAIVMETFPPAQRGIAVALWSAGSVAGSIFGPIIGGQIADNFHWRWVFYPNIPVSFVVVLLSVLFLSDPPYLQKGVKRIDALGFFYLAIWVGCLQVILGRGQRLDWFSSNLITGLTIIAVPAFIAFVIRELSEKEPIVDLRIFKNLTFTAGTIMMSVQMFAFYGCIVLIALFAQTIMGYTGYQAGLVVASGAIASVIAMPLAGRLLSYIDPRLLIGTGALVSGFGMLKASHLNFDATFLQVMTPRLLLGVGLAWIWVSINVISMGAVPKEKMGQASGLLNLMRVLGGSFGIALLTTILTRGSQIHQNYLVSHVTRWDLTAQERLSMFTSAFRSAGSDPFTAGKQALAYLYSEIQFQASMLSFMDDFRLLAVLLFGIIPLLLMMKGTKLGK